MSDKEAQATSSVVAVEAPKRRFRKYMERARGPICTNLLLRITGLVLATITIALLVTDYEYAELDIGIYIARWNMSSAYVLLLVASAIVAGYQVLHALLACMSVVVGRNVSSHNKAFAWLSFLGDQGLAYFLLAAASASTEMAVISRHGSANGLWSPICYFVNGFCNQIVACVVLGFIGAFILALCSISSAYYLFTDHIRHGY